MTNILEEIAAHKRSEVARLKTELTLSEMEGKLETNDRLNFRAAIVGSDRVNIIAELKKASPSKGVLIENFDVEKIASSYHAGGAAALSVLADQKYFQGSPEFIATAKAVSGLPILYKEFIVDEFQIPYARFKKADAILLIVSILKAAEIKSMIKLAGNCGLDVIVEVHDSDEAKIAIDCGANIIGVNNRNLKDFSVSLKTSETISVIIPDNIIKIAESGIYAPADITRLREFGYSCFLIGEALIKSADPVKLLRSLKSA
ncbi:MAG: indole-3-glycerol phosphate synthase TrpC [candidate division Zixibacteria bacterium]|nr:indole-3-glycerol phosphate synthase TrpC [candidate division Zixibacteria bacterium]